MDGRAPLTKKYSLIDIGLNLAATQFDKDRADVIRRAREVGVERMIVTGDLPPCICLGVMCRPSLAY
jgi:hypothetical protein